MDANDDVVGGAVATLRAEAVVIEDYATLDDAMQKRILHAVMVDFPVTKAMVKTEKAAYEALCVQYHKTEESLDKASMKIAEHERQKKITKRNKQGQAGSRPQLMRWIQYLSFNPLALVLLA